MNILSQGLSQVFWTENFGSGCNSGTLANGYLTSNGSWTISSTGANGANANRWYISAEENGAGSGNCGEGCGLNPTLHIGTNTADLGATYNKDNSFGDPSTSVRAESPTIDCSAECEIHLSFEMIHNGDGLLDNFNLWYFDGAIWTLIDNPKKTELNCMPLGEWENYIIPLPSSSSGNANVKIGFEWINNNDGIGTDPSVAIYNIQLNSIDTDPPILSCVDSVSLFLDQNCDALIPDLLTPTYITATDNCSNFSDLIFSQSVLSGTILSGHLTVQQVDIYIEDESGNSGSCAIIVIGRDTISPIIDCPVSNIPIDVDSSCMAQIQDYSTLINPIDNCSSLLDFTFDQSPVIGTTITENQVININVTDPAGNSNSCTFQLNLVDTISPTIVCPSNKIQMTSIGNCDTLLLDYRNQIIWNDNCTFSISDVTISQIPEPLSLIAGNNAVTIEITDSSENSNQCTFFVDVIDGESPTYNCLSDTFLVAGSDCEYFIPDLTPVVNYADNCTSFADITVTQTPIPNTLIYGDSIISMTFTDLEGNSSLCSIVVGALDTLAPQIICPTDSILNNGSNCDYVLVDFTSEVIADDECGSVFIAQLPNVGQMISTGEHTIEMIVNDESGNSSSCMFNLSIIENIPPTISCPNDTTKCDPIVNYVLPQFNDNCGPAQLIQIDSSQLTSGDIFPVGITVQSFEVIDLSGNTATCSFSIEILPPTEQAQIITTTTQICDTISVQLEAVQPTTDTGEWIVLTGGASLNNQFANSTGANNLDFGLNQFIWQISSAQCGITTDTLTISVFDLPFPASIPNDTLIICFENELSLSANLPNVGMGNWSSSNPAIVFEDESSPNTVALNLADGWNVLNWAITNGNCPVSLDSVEIFINPSAEIFGYDTVLCIEDYNLELIGNYPQEGVEAYWYANVGNALLSNNTSNIAAIENISVGINTFIYSLNHYSCGISYDTLNIQMSQCFPYNPKIPTLFTPNGDGKNDVFVLENLNELYPNCKVSIVNRWGNLVFESEGYINPWDGTLFNTGNPLPLGTYYYRLELTEDSSSDITGPISILR